MIYQLKITLADSKPPIWRRIAVDGQIALDQLHWIFQLAMGWTNSHLHQFMADENRYGICEPEFNDWDTELLDQEKYRLQDIAAAVGAKFTYEYDFGDSWIHQVQVETIQEPEPGVFYPYCLAGKRACPPEDVGGIWGYYEFLDAMADKDHPEHESCVQWIGGAFDPAFFSVESTDRQLAQLDCYKVFKPKEDLTYTPKQGQYLAFIYYYTKLNRRPPAQADIQRYFNISSPAVNSMLKTLEKQGMISRVAHQSRSIKLLLDRDELPDLE